MRDDFTEEVKLTLAARVGNRCSNPSCHALTSGPQDDPAKALNVGVAAHITAAAQGGPRYDSQLTSEQRCHPDNGIWLCQTCAKLVDNDTSQFPAGFLRAWKAIAEHNARSTIGKTASVVPTLGELGHSVQLTLRHQRLVTTAEHHNYRLTVTMTNMSAAVIDSYHLDVLFPTKLLHTDVSYVLELPNRRTDTHSLFRVSTETGQVNTLYPGDAATTMTIDYYVDRHIFHYHHEWLQQNVVATLYIKGSPPMTIQKPMSELQEF